MRLLAVLVSLLFGAFCVYGLLATLEPLEAGVVRTARVVYGVGLAVSLLMLFVALRGRRR